MRLPQTIEECGLLLNAMCLVVLLGCSQVASMPTVVPDGVVENLVRALSEDEGLAKLHAAVYKDAAWMNVVASPNTEPVFPFEVMAPKDNREAALRHKEQVVSDFVSMRVPVCRQELLPKGIRVVSAHEDGQDSEVEGPLQVSVLLSNVVKNPYAPQGERIGLFAKVHVVGPTSVNLGTRVYWISIGKKGDRWVTREVVDTGVRMPAI